MVQTSTLSTRTVELITVDTALAAIKAGLKESQNLGADVSIAVYNSLLTLTAASIRRPTGNFADHLTVALPLASGNLLTNLGGGLPIRFGGVHVGAIGVGGGTVEQDIAIAKAALSVIGAEPID
ncbi:heme-binding protein [Nostoc muscorum FACHB-395]|nr:heme-binding protein [Desmonostoc muscorum FACHB-395]